MNTDFLEQVPETEWNTAASYSGIDPVELQRKIKEALKDYQEPSGPLQITVTRHGVEAVPSAEDEPEIEIGIGPICSIKVRILADIRSVTDFKIEVALSFTLLGLRFYKEEIKFDQNRLEHPFTVGVPGISGSVTVGWRLKDNNTFVCSILGGSLAILGGDPLEFKVDLICLPVP